MRVRIGVALRLMGILVWAGPALAHEAGADEQRERQHQTMRESGQERGGRHVREESRAGSEKESTTARFVRGRLAQASGDTVVIDTSDGRTVTLSLDDRTAIAVDGKVARASDLNPGEPVQASYDDLGREKVATSIRAGEHVALPRDATQGSNDAGSGYPPPQAGDTGKGANPNTYQGPGTMQGSGSAGTGSGYPPPQAGDTGKGANPNTYQGPGTMQGSGSAEAGSGDPPPQAGDTGKGANPNTYQGPGAGR